MQFSDALKVRARSQFGGVADQYATSEIHVSGASLSLLLEGARPQPEWTVLDVATGAGHTALTFAPHVDRVIGLDFTKAMVRKTSEIAVVRGLENIRVVAGDADRLPVATGSINMVTCGLAFHHFPNATIALSEFRRVLRPDGFLA